MLKLKSKKQQKEETVRELSKQQKQPTKEQLTWKCVDSQTEPAMMLSELTKDNTI